MVMIINNCLYMRAALQGFSGPEGTKRATSVNVQLPRLQKDLCTHKCNYNYKYSCKYSYTYNYKYLSLSLSLCIYTYIYIYTHIIVIRDLELRPTAMTCVRARLRETLWISPPGSAGAEVARSRKSHVWCRPAFVGRVFTQDSAKGGAVETGCSDLCGVIHYFDI